MLTNNPGLIQGGQKLVWEGVTPVDEKEVCR